MGRGWRVVAVGLLLAGCGADAPSETGRAAMRRALASALQARGSEAVAALRGLDPAGLTPRDAAVRDCMLERLDSRRPPAIVLDDRELAEILAAYREYWLRSLRAEHPSADNEAWLLAALNSTVAAEGRKPSASMDDLEPALQSVIAARGYHPLLGVTLPLRELMLWRTETETTYDVRLPESTQRVTVVFMDDFASLGWAGFATCDRHHSGGWTRPDRLYAVRSAYDTASENFRVSYLAHEGQHFSDNRRFPDLTRQEDLEYRAKLVELAVGATSLYDLLDNFAGNVGDDPAVPHSHANGRVVRDLAARLFPGATGAPTWRNESLERINAAAAALLREDTGRLTPPAAPPPPPSRNRALRSPPT
jgi:hypothetical protein